VHVAVKLRISAVLFVSAVVLLLSIAVLLYRLAYAWRQEPLLVSALTGVCAGFILILLCALGLVRALGRLRKVFEELKTKYLFVDPDIRTGNEFAEVIAALKDFLSGLRLIFGSFNNNAALVSSSVFDLSASAKEITTTANQQSASVSEIVSTMEGSKNLSEQIALKTREVADLAAQTEGLSRKGAELRDASQDMMEDIRNQNLKIINEIRNLTDMLTRIDEAVEIIDGIADQTKLIAFNASLEASSSGEAGARFSVVASEIRRFADNVVDSTAEIKQKIGEVQAASQILITEANNGSKQIDQGYERMVEQKAVFENIVENSQNVATRSQQISNLSKQQEYASAQIFTTLKEISLGVKQFVAATASTSRIADNLNEKSGELREIVGKYLNEIPETPRTDFPPDENTKENQNG
jgi:methyl-accepting chemotaxis protein